MSASFAKHLLNLEEGEIIESPLGGITEGAMMTTNTSTRQDTVASSKREHLTQGGSRTTAPAMTMPTTTAQEDMVYSNKRKRRVIEDDEDDNALPTKMQKEDLNYSIAPTSLFGAPLLRGSEIKKVLLKNGITNPAHMQMFEANLARKKEQDRIAAEEAAEEMGREEESIFGSQKRKRDEDEGLGEEGARPSKKEFQLECADEEGTEAGINKRKRVDEEVLEEEDVRPTKKITQLDGTNDHITEDSTSKPQKKLIPRLPNGQKVRKQKQPPKVNPFTTKHPVKLTPAECEQPADPNDGTFFKLPWDIRLQIYDYIFPHCPSLREKKDKKPQKSNELRRDHVWQAYPKLDPRHAIMRVRKSYYDEIHRELKKRVTSGQYELVIPMRREKITGYNLSDADTATLMDYGKITLEAHAVKPIEYKIQGQTKIGGAFAKIVPVLRGLHMVKPFEKCKEIKVDIRKSYQKDQDPEKVEKKIGEFFEAFRKEVRTAAPGVVVTRKARVEKKKGKKG